MDWLTDIAIPKAQVVTNQNDPLTMFSLRPLDPHDCIYCILGFSGYLSIFGTEQHRSNEAEKEKRKKRVEINSRENDSLIMGCMLLFPDRG